MPRVMRPVKRPLFAMISTTAKSKAHVVKRRRPRAARQARKLQVARRRSIGRCQVCGREFILTRTKRVYCSPKCARVPVPPHTAGLTARQAVKLWNSGATQTAIARELRVSRQRIGQVLRRHIDELNAPLRSRRHSPGRSTRPCPECGAGVTVGTTRVYCSKTCRHAALLRKNAPWSRLAMITITCDGCGRTFTRSRYQHSVSMAGGCRHTYCSQKCYNKNSRRA